MARDSGTPIYSFLANSIIPAIYAIHNIEIQTMSKKKIFRALWLLFAAIIVVEIGVYIQEQYNKSEDTKPIQSLRQGSADYCKKYPDFVETMHLQKPISIDLSQRLKKGLVMITGGRERKVFQLPSWQDAGYLGPYALDEMGNLYVAPIPFVSIDEYDPENQNVIYKVDTKSGVMKAFLEMPKARSPHANNPYNILGLAYDCDTKSLYVSSVTGSSYDDEVGRVYQVDVAQKKVVDRLDQTDVIGLGIYNFEHQKKLYMGMARVPEIRSISLDEKGHFIQSPQLEFSLNELPGGSYDKCHRIRFFGNNTMELKGIEFNYSLHAESKVQRNIYTFKLDHSTGQWTFVEVHKQ